MKQPKAKTVAEAVTWLESVLPDDDLKKLAGMDEDDLVQLDLGLGAYIRNDLPVWHNEPLLKDAGVCHESGASQAIIRALWLKLRLETKSSEPES
ncbi:MAG: hypothetical protein A3K19_16300 [Lentisphaerae bacterium RIFOXYB12_FULL_65_16]|nr:MAG: hypothetical protein A3K18_20605 [Lentisphaerae bacterium RIFOXYA12_64_32]OGV84495.1 MAG: hypothetical protein A3K19_16300 [Lentisphaerae bacterium RIFOXYB12_FULL_65_16]